MRQVLIKEKQCDGYKETALYDMEQGIFGGGWSDSPLVTIHYDGNTAYVIAPAVPEGLAAKSYDHALGFCVSLLGITDLIQPDNE